MLNILILSVVILNVVRLMVTEPKFVPSFGAQFETSFLLYLLGN
jgi:hypothetical protein